MLYIIVLFAYANSSLAFNEFNIDSTDEIDMLFWEEFMLKSRNINAIAVYLQDEQNKNRYNYYDFVGFSYIDENSYVVDNDNFSYTYVGDEIDN